MTFDPALMQRYDVRGPRYTSYPTALQFTNQFSETDYRQMARLSNEGATPRDLSLYVHLPFCQQACWYCACHRSITQRSDRSEAYLRELMDEIRLQSVLFDPDRPVRQLHLGGGTPTFYSPEDLAGMLDQIGKHFTLAAPGEREFSVEIDPRSVTVDDVRALAHMGFDRMSMGIQDFDPVVQEAVNRIQSVEMVTEQVNAARESGVRSMSFDLIYGLPQQTVEGFTRTLEQVIALAPDRLSIYSYAHMPDRFPVQRLIDSDSLPGASERMALFTTAVTALADAGYEHIGMDHFARPGDPLVAARDQGRLQRNFQGYSTHAECDLIALGASAIGKLGDSYSQNVADIRDWQQCLSEGRLAISKGLVLSADDVIRQQVIQAIMCNGRVDTDAISKARGIDFWTYFESAMPMVREMAADGLLQFLPDGFQVTDKGRFLLRNLAMQFDAYNGPGSNQQRFSRTI